MLLFGLSSKLKMNFQDYEVNLVDTNVDIITNICHKFNILPSSSHKKFDYLNLIMYVASIALPQSENLSQGN